MGKKLYVGNLSFNIDDRGLSDIFASFGSVESARVISDRDTGRSKGFGFVEMSSPTEAQAAIDGLNGTSQDGRALNVSEAKPQAPRSSHGGGGYNSRY
jgi:RNA recognition motif-containing protein